MNENEVKDVARICSEEIKSVARLYCELLNLDPDELVASHTGRLAVISKIPRWQTRVPEVVKFLAMQEASNKFKELQNVSKQANEEIRSGLKELKEKHDKE